MSALTTEERIALDEIFLSMSVKHSPLLNVKRFVKTLSASSTFVSTKLFPKRFFIRSRYKFYTKRLGYKR